MTSQSDYNEPKDYTIQSGGSIVIVRADVLEILANGRVVLKLNNKLVAVAPARAIVTLGNL